MSAQSRSCSPLPARTTPVEGWSPPYRTYFWLLACGWTLAVAISLAWNLAADARQVRGLARETARALFQKDLFYRQWNAQQGGVYVPVSLATPPNPHLNVPERDLVTPSGKALTLMNPAYMTRQVFELQNQTLGTRGHITSLKPIRPENAPDAWERQALESFERGCAEVSAIERIEGQPYLRLMRPLITDTACLRCHAEQGYHAGEVRGGISVAVPMAQFEAVASVPELILAHAALWTLGMVGLGLGNRHLRRQVLIRRKSEDHLRQLSRAVEQNPASIVITDAQGNMEYVNPKFCRLTGYTEAEVFGQNPRVLKSGEAPPEAYRQMWETITAGREWRGEFHNKKKNGELYWEDATSSPIRDTAGRTTHYVAVKEDITARKQTEAERDQLIQDLQSALAKVKSLGGLLPICAGCKKIRDDQGYWSQVESYIQKHSEATFTHGLCPDCIKRLYPELEQAGNGDSPRETP